MKNKTSKFMIFAGAVMMLFGCGDTDVNVYAGTKPEITLKDFYSGPVHGYGIFQNRSGTVKDRYYATLVPTWNGNEGIITEKQWNEQGKLFFQQEWKIKISDDGHNFSGTASKIKGVVKGESRGYAMHMKYQILAPRDDGGEILVSSDDWTYLQPDGSGINKITMRKFGFHVGDAIYHLHKLAKGEKLYEGYFPQ